jgi:hypothetical protein
MGDDWLSSWYWRWCSVSSEPPNEPQPLVDDLAEGIARLTASALEWDENDDVPPFLSLAHARLSSDPGVREHALRIDYRVAPRTRFPQGAGARGPARRAFEQIARLASAGQLGPTRGPYHLRDVIAQGGIALITARTDMLDGSEGPRLGTFIVLASSRGGISTGMRFALFEPATKRLRTVADDALSRAWHASLAGGEILAIYPPVASSTRTRVDTYSQGETMRPEDPRVAMRRTGNGPPEALVNDPRTEPRLSR